MDLKYFVPNFDITKIMNNDEWNSCINDDDKLMNFLQTKINVLPKFSMFKISSNEYHSCIYMTDGNIIYKSYKKILYEPKMHYIDTLIIDPIFDVKSCDIIFIDRIVPLSFLWNHLEYKHQLVENLRSVTDTSIFSFGFESLISYRGLYIRVVIISYLTDFITETVNNPNERIDVVNKINDVEYLRCYPIVYFEKYMSKYKPTYIRKKREIKNDYLTNSVIVLVLNEN